MNKSQIRALYDQDQRIGLEHPNTRREVTPNIVRHINASKVEEGFISYSQLSEANADDTIREQINYFESIGQDFEWKLYDYDQPFDLKERLKAHGFIIEEAEAIMVLNLEDAAEILWQPIPPYVQQIRDPQRLVDVQSVEQQVWNEDDSFYLEFLGYALRNYPEQMSVYVAYVNEQPASAAWIYFPSHSRFASLWGGSTVSAFRKQGLYTALLAARAQEAKSRQVKFLTVDASPMSRPILERMGFEMIATSYPCKWKRKPKN